MAGLRRTSNALSVIVRDQVSHIFDNRIRSLKREYRKDEEELETIRNNPRKYKRSDYEFICFDARRKLNVIDMKIDEEEWKEKFFSANAHEIVASICAEIDSGIDSSSVDTVDASFISRSVEKSLDFRLDPSNNPRFRKFMLESSCSEDSKSYGYLHTLFDSIFYIDRSDDSSGEEGVDFCRCSSEEDDSLRILEEYYENVDALKRASHPIYSIKSIFLVDCLEDIDEFVHFDPFFDSLIKQGKLTEKSFHNIFRYIKKGEPFLLSYDDVIDVRPHRLYRFDDSFLTPDGIFRCYLFLDNIDGRIFNVENGIEEAFDDMPDELENVSDDSDVYRSGPYITSVYKENDDMRHSHDYDIDTYLSASDNEDISSLSSSQYLAMERLLDMYHRGQSDRDDRDMWNFSEDRSVIQPTDMSWSDVLHDSNTSLDDIPHTDRDVGDRSNDMSDSFGDDIAVSNDMDDLPVDDDVPDDPDMEGHDYMDDYDDMQDGMSYASGHEDGDDGLVTDDDLQDEMDDVYEDDVNDEQASEEDESEKCHVILIDKKIICYMTPEMCYLKMDERMKKALAVKQRDIYSYRNHKCLEVRDSYYTVYKIMKHGSSRLRFSSTRDTASSEELERNFNSVTAERSELEASPMKPLKGRR